MLLLITSTVLAATTSCSTRYRVPESPMPPNTVLLSQVMRELSSQPGFTEQVLDQIGGGRKQGPALLTPQLAVTLRKLILGKDWQGLDRFPGWDMRRLTATVNVLNRIESSKSRPLQEALNFIDLGPYSLEQAKTISLDEPSDLAPFAIHVTPLGPTLNRGDGPNSLAAEHPESQRLADVLNRLAMNRLEGAKTLTVRLGGQSISSPEELTRIFSTVGFTVEMDDARYFANFGHLHYKGQDVMAPFWVNTKVVVPGSGGLFKKPRPLLVPVSHAEYELHISNRHGAYADVSYYFGIDGKSEWRTMDELDQAWVLKRNAHRYQGEQAAEVMRLATVLTLAYAHQHEDRPALPFGGYYALGVCQDGVAAIERRMTGAVTLFPNTADGSLFDDPRDAEANAMMNAIPKDREGKAPDPARIFGSLPASDLNQIKVPGLSSDLQAAYSAWKSGKLKRID